MSQKYLQHQKAHPVQWQLMYAVSLELLTTCRQLKRLEGLLSPVVDLKMSFGSLQSSRNFLRLCLLLEPYKISSTDGMFNLEEIATQQMTKILC